MVSTKDELLFELGEPARGSAVRGLRLQHDLGLRVQEIGLVVACVVHGALGETLDFVVGFVLRIALLLWQQFLDVAVDSRHRTLLSVVALSCGTTVIAVVPLLLHQSHDHLLILEDLSLKVSLRVLRLHHVHLVDGGRAESIDIDLVPIDQIKRVLGKLIVQIAPVVAA